MSAATGRIAHMRQARPPDDVMIFGRVLHTLPRACCALRVCSDELYIEALDLRGAVLQRIQLRTTELAIRKLAD